MELSIPEQRQADSIDMTEGKRGGVTMVSIKLSEYQALKLEVEHLKQHIRDLNSDLEGTIKDCNKHHGEGEF